jgi:hypothetical protein
VKRTLNKIGLNRTYAVFIQVHACTLREWYSIEKLFWKNTDMCPFHFHVFSSTESLSLPKTEPIQNELFKLEGIETRELSLTNDDVTTALLIREMSVCS